MLRRVVFLSARGIHTYFLFSLSGNEISTERRRGEEREMRLISFGDYNCIYEKTFWFCKFDVMETFSIAFIKIKFNRFAIVLLNA